MTPDTPNPAIVLEGDNYPDIARIIDVVAFLVLASSLFVPIIRVGFRMLHLVDTDVALIFAGAALVGLGAALAKYRRIVVISAVVYGALFALFVVNYFQKIENLRTGLKDNLFGGLVDAVIGLEWGCAVITFGVLAVLCSGLFVRRDAPRLSGERVDMDFRHTDFPDVMDGIRHKVNDDNTVTARTPMGERTYSNWELFLRATKTRRW
jgi:hypothetical protein